MRPFSKNSAIGLLVSLMGGLLACSGGGGGHGEGGADAAGPPVTHEEPQNIVYSSPADPRIASLVGPDGEVVTFFGQRGPTGVAESVYAYSVEEKGDVTLVNVDAQGFPIYLRAENGVEFTFEWNHDLAQVRVNVYDPTGAEVASEVLQLEIDDDAAGLAFGPSDDVAEQAPRNRLHRSIHHVLAGRAKVRHEPQLSEWRVVRLLRVCSRRRNAIGVGREQTSDISF